MRERQNEIEHQRATVTTVTDKESDRESKSDKESKNDRERERDRGGVSGARTETETGRETERDT